MTKEQYIKERNELAKQLYIHNENFSIEDSIKNADSFMQKLYNCTLEECEYEKTPIVSITDIDGISYVNVKAFGEKFAISIHDFDDGKNDFSYDTLMPRLKELGLQTFTRKQAILVCFYLDEINEKLIEAGGERLARAWYLTQDLYIPRVSRDGCNGYSWYFNGENGGVNYGNCYTSYFRCRTIINI